MSRNTSLGLAVLTVIALSGPAAQADPFTFAFTGTFDFTGSAWPGIGTFDTSITVDNGGSSPFDSFNLDDLEVIHLISGPYEFEWNASAGGTSSWTSPDFWKITYDGLAATWTLADFPVSAVETLGLFDATDNQGGLIPAEIHSLFNPNTVGHRTVVKPGIGDAIDWEALIEGAPKVFRGQQVPEPGALSLAAFGFIALAASRWRSMRR